MGSITWAASGEGGLGFGFLIGVTVIRLSLRTFIKVSRVCSAVSVGRMRQLIVARAVCGNAFSAWPADSIVATQVVRIVALYAGIAERSATDFASGGFFVAASIAAPISGVSIFDTRSK